MGTMIDSLAIDENDDRFKTGFSNEGAQIHLKDLDPQAASLILKTQNQLPNLTPPTPSATDGSLEGRVTLGRPEPIEGAPEPVEGAPSPEETILSQLEEIKTEVATTFTFPNLAWEAVKAGLAKEGLTNQQLNIHIKEAEKHQKDIDLLLDFSAELTAMKDDQPEMTEKMKTVLGELKERGIELWKGEDQALTKEKISELKSLTSAQVDKLRSNLQILFTTKIQVLIQSIGAIMETLKDIIRNNTKLINAANRLPGH